MRSLNINITDNQYKLVDNLIYKLGFASRSELFRSLLRQIEYNSNEWDSGFKSPATRDSRQVMKAFRGSGKYNKSFLSSLAKGLARSKYFK